MTIRIYTTSDIRQILKISKGQVFKLIRSGEIVFFRIGKSIRITETALNDYIAEHSNKKEMN